MNVVITILLQGKIARPSKTFIVGFVKCIWENVLQNSNPALCQASGEQPVFSRSLRNAWIWNINT